MIDKNELIDLLAKAVKLGMDALPDGKYYEYCWEEMMSEEQDKVKEVRKELSIALEVYEVFRKEKTLVVNDSGGTKHPGSSTIPQGGLGHALLAKEEEKIVMDFNEISRDPLGPYVKGGSDYTLGKEKKLLKINKEDIEKEK